MAEQPLPNASDRGASEDGKELSQPSPRRLPPGELNTAAVPSTESPQTTPHLTPMSPEAQDRVFPMRSLVSVDPNPTPSAKSAKSDGEVYFQTGDPSTAARPLSTPQSQKGVRDYDFAQGGTSAFTHQRSNSHDVNGGPMTQMTSILADTSSDKSGQTSGQGSSLAGSIRSTRSNKSWRDESGNNLVTARFKHLVTEGGHAVITGRGGETLQRCEDEPIHIPGAVQSFGLLIVLSEDADGKLLVRVSSENSTDIIGYTPQHLFQLDSFTDILSDEQADNLLDHVDFIKDESSDPATNGPEVFILSIRHPITHKQKKLWCAIHVHEEMENMIICEFELEDDQRNPLVPPGEDVDVPVNTLHTTPTSEELAESTRNMSKPLRVLRSARRRRGETAAMEVFNIMAQVQEQLASAPTLEVFLKVLVGVVKELTGFHRVMVYQFDQQWNGRVVTELVDSRATKDLYKGLNFPASDIPKQARDLYKINKVRLLYDRDQETSRLVCRTLEDLERPVNMTHCYLRAMSPIHIKYLQNMAVRASMSISINVFDELWGLISCHSYGSRGMRVSFPIRKMCRLIGETASRNIERLSYASRLQARKLINTAPSEKNPAGYIIASSDDLLKLFDADFGLVSIADETKILGQLESTQEALALMEYLRLRKLTSVTTCQDIRMDFPDLRYPPGFQVIAGFLLVPLSASGDDFIVFLRRGQSREVKWAGNPYSKFVREGTEGYLEPRTSFKTWTETVIGKCRDWTEDQIETAAVLCLIYGKFIEVWRQKEAALQNSQLTRLLLANSAHEVRTPLNAIINYLEIAMEGALDQETRDNLSRSHSASKSLIYVINDLLDLTKTEEGNDLVARDTSFDLFTTIGEAASSFNADAARKQIEYIVNQDPSLPRMVVGDQRRVRQAIFNIVANAVHYTSKGSVTVDAYLLSSTAEHVEVEVAVTDTGVGMSEEKLDSLFAELEQVQIEGDSQPAPLEEKPAQRGSQVLGLGLAVVSRIIRNMTGQLRVKSEKDKGSRFVLQMGFDLPQDLQEAKQLEEGARATSPPTSIVAHPGERTLVSKSSVYSLKEKPRTDVARRNSGESLQSTNSIRSGSSGRSDVDRLIDALKEPHLVGGAPSTSSTGRPGSLDSRRSPSHINTRPGLTRSQTERGPVIRRHSTELKQTGSESSISAPGQYDIQDSGTPVKPVRVADEADIVNAGSPITSTTRNKARVSFAAGSKSGDMSESAAPAPPPQEGKPRVLVAEDDPINSKIISKRLEKLGYEVTLTVNGEACASTHAENPGQFDAVLMDIQMPIVDGLTSTKMIRSQEKANPNHVSALKDSHNSRIPIFAVSASLVERERPMYMETGFDGWILKPIDFKRLDTLLHGIASLSTRQNCIYRKGEWERGGWFFADKLPDIEAARTKPEEAKAEVATQSELPKPYPRRDPDTDDPFDDKISKEQERLEGLDDSAVAADSQPEDPGESGNLEKSVEHPGNAAGG